MYTVFAYTWNYYTLCAYYNIIRVSYVHTCTRYCTAIKTPRNIFIYLFIISLSIFGRPRSLSIYLISFAPSPPPFATHAYISNILIIYTYYYVGIHYYFIILCVYIVRASIPTSRLRRRPQVVPMTNETSDYPCDDDDRLEPCARRGARCLRLRILS